MPAVELDLKVTPKNEAKRKLKAFARLLDVKCTIRQKEISGDELVMKSTSKLQIFVEANSTSKVGNYLLAVHSAFHPSPLIYVGTANRRYMKKSEIEAPKNPTSGYQDSSDDTLPTSLSISLPENYSSIPQAYDSNWMLLEKYLHKFTEIPSESESSNISSSYESPTEIKPTNKQKHITTPVLQRASGILKIGNVELDKSKPKSWRFNQILMLLEDTDLGVGLDEEDISNIKLKGYIFENIVDALISFNGDKEAKIAHVVKEVYCDPAFSQCIVRWAFSNLLEYK